MRKIALLTFWIALLSLTPASAQETGAITAGDALDAETCGAVSKRVMRELEGFTRMKFRRPVPVGVLPKAAWDNMIKQEGYAGMTAKSGLAFYNLVGNSITVSPWVIGGYGSGSPRLESKEEWINRLESIIIHELMHALHNQNFHVILGGARQASLRVGGQSEEEIDAATVEFLTAEGTAELVSVRVVSDAARPHLSRVPGNELYAVGGYLKRYQPNNKDPFRTLLSNSGYKDGLDVMHQLSLKAGPRGVRAILYRPPPAVLFFNPTTLASLSLDDPPDPDSVFGFLSPDRPTGLEVYLAVNPGHGRFFGAACHTPGGPRADGCLVGYVTTVGSEEEAHGVSNYAFWVTDPDRKGTWSADQVASLKELNADGAKESTRPLPMGKGMNASLLTIKMQDGSVYLRGEAEGMVVLAQESKPTKNLEERVLLALRALQLRRPTPGLYTKAAAEARARLNG